MNIKVATFTVSEKSVNTLSGLSRAYEHILNNDVTFHIKLCIWDIGIWQTEKTKMKYHIRQHLNRVCTVC